MLRAGCSRVGDGRRSGRLPLLDRPGDPGDTGRAHDLVSSFSPETCLARAPAAFIPIPRNRAIPEFLQAPSARIRSSVAFANLAFGTSGPDDIRRARFLLFDLPAATVMRDVRRREGPPDCNRCTSASAVGTCVRRRHARRRQALPRSLLPAGADSPAETRLARRRSDRMLPLQNRRHPPDATGRTEEVPR